MRAVSNLPPSKAQVYTVTVSYADKPDETAIADVLSMLMNTDLKG